MKTFLFIISQCICYTAFAQTRDLKTSEVRQNDIYSNSLSKPTPPFSMQMAFPDSSTLVIINGNIYLPASAEAKDLFIKRVAPANVIIYKKTASPIKKILFYKTD